MHSESGTRLVLTTAAGAAVPLELRSHARSSSPACPLTPG